MAHCTTTPPAKRLRQSSLADFFRGGSASTRVSDDTPTRSSGAEAIGNSRGSNQRGDTIDPAATAAAAAGATDNHQELHPQLLLLLPRTSSNPHDDHLNQMEELKLDDNAHNKQNNQNNNNNNQNSNSNNDISNKEPPSSRRIETVIEMGDDVRDTLKPSVLSASAAAAAAADRGSGGRGGGGFSGVDGDDVNDDGNEKVDSGKCDHRSSSSHAGASERSPTNPSKNGSESISVVCTSASTVEEESANSVHTSKRHLFDLRPPSLTSGTSQDKCLKGLQKQHSEPTQGEHPDGRNVADGENSENHTDKLKTINLKVDGGQLEPAASLRSAPLGRLADEKESPLSAPKDPKRFYSSGAGHRGVGYTVFKCSQFEDRVSSSTGLQSTRGSKPSAAEAFETSANVDRRNDNEPKSKQKMVPSFRATECGDAGRLPVNLDQEPGEIPPEMSRFPDDVVWRSGPLEGSPDHTVLIKGPFDATSLHPCEAEPATLTECWDDYHVKMPYSQRSLYRNDEGVSGARWDIIQKALLQPIDSFYTLREAILSYNCGYSWDMSELENVIEEMSSKDRHDFFHTLLPDMVRLALNLPTICTQPPPLLQKGHSHSVTMSQQQASSLLANAFFCTFPRRNASKPGSQYSNYPTVNLHTLFNTCDRPQRSRCRKEKIKCILNYFRRVTQKMPLGNLTFSRIRFRCRVGWEDSQAKFKKAFVTSRGLIEDHGYGMLMVDFANRKVGGGVLRDGCVQEEILFVIYPELITARLFTEALDDDEALLVTGLERFNEYKGYSDDFCWRGNVVDVRERDSWGRRYTQLVAIDAVAYSGKKEQREQLGIDKIMRELIKSFCGFQTPGFPRASIATGNWGCGAFGGDARLKFLLQWMAASRAGRPLVYFTFGDHQLMCQLRAIQDLVLQQDISIGDMFLLLKRYDRLYIEGQQRDPPTTLFDFLYATFHQSNDDDNDKPDSS